MTSARHIVFRRATNHPVGGAVMISVMLCLLVAAGLVRLSAQPETADARIWLGQAARIETFMREARVVEVEDIGRGVTNPKRAELEPGGPVARIAFKPIRPGNYRGHWESYESEIAAYELDKLLGLEMVPPVVEKRIEGQVGAAVLWAEPAQSFREIGGVPTPPPAIRSWWNIQLIRAKMFHNLIYNKDPNLGNWLVDPAWNVILIDHSRAFTTPTRMVHALKRVDEDLWGRFLGLGEEELQTAVGEWLSHDQLEAMLRRRDRMVDDIEQLVAERGRAAVFVRYRTSRGPGGELVGSGGTPMVGDASELTWSGQVVSLADYRGHQTFGDAARTGLARGHTLGIVTGNEGLLCLAPDPHDTDPYQRLSGLLGRRADVFGVMTDEENLTVVHVTLARPGQ